LIVYAGLTGVLLAGSLLGSVGFHLIILIHVSAWLVYVAHRLSQQPVAQRPTLWTWCRTTPVGFLCLHAGVGLLVLVLMACRIYAWERDGWLSDLVARTSFPYWSLMHISLAFWRGR
jgi:hypothetical protein